MKNSKKIISHFIPSIAASIFIALFIILSLIRGQSLLNDGDTGYHIRAGEYIINTLSIPKHDIFSFITPPLPWTAHEWLSEIIMATIHQAFGLNGIVVFFSFIICLVYYLLFKILRAKTDNIIINVFIVMLVMTASQIHWLARPHIFSLLLFLIWYYLLDEYQYNNRNYLYFQFPMMLLWVNLHGGYLAGFILNGIYLFGNVVKLIFSQGAEKDIAKKKSRVLGLTSIGCLFISLLNPYTYHILLFPFKLVSNKFIMDNVLEFLSPNFHEPTPFKYLLFLMIIIFALSKVKTNLIELILILTFTNMSLFSVRYIPLFAIVVAPILSRQTGLILKQTDGKVSKFLNKRSDNISAIDASAKSYLWIVVAMILVIVLTSGDKIVFKFDSKKKPVAALEFIKKEKIQGNMFANDEFGDYIIYAAWPEYKVFVDGRSDMYGTDIMKEYLKVVRVRPGWDEVLKKYDINWIIYNANSTLSLFLMERDSWKLIYADKVANIFVKDIPKNHHLMKKYPGVELVISDPDESERSWLSLILMNQKSDIE